MNISGESHGKSSRYSNLSVCPFPTVSTYNEVAHAPGICKVVADENSFKHMF